VPLLALVYLAWGAGAVGIQFAAMLAFVALPLAAIWRGVCCACSPTLPALRACVACALALICMTPLYYLRRVIPAPAIVQDLIVMLLLVVASVVATGGLRGLLGDLATPDLRPAAPFVFVVLPLLLCLVWSGFEVPAGDTIRYYGSIRSTTRTCR
jgi:hypothetical protein